MRNYRRKLPLPRMNDFFAIYESIRRGVTVAEIHEWTMIDEWFLEKLVNIHSMEQRLQTETLTDELYLSREKNGIP